MFSSFFRHTPFLLIFSVVGLSSCGRQAAENHINEKIDTVPVPVPVPVTPKITLQINNPTEILFVNQKHELFTATGDGGLGLDLGGDDQLNPYAGIPMKVEWENIKDESKEIRVSAYGDSPLCHDLFSYDEKHEWISIDPAKIENLQLCHVEVLVAGSYQDVRVKEERKFDVVFNPTFDVYAQNKDPFYLYLKDNTQLDSPQKIVKWLKDKRVRQDGLDLSFQSKQGLPLFPIDNVNALIGAQNLTKVNLANVGLRDIRALTYMKNLHEIDLSGLKTEASTLATLEKLPLLTSLSVRNINLKDLTVITGHMPYLKSLDISDNNGIENLEKIGHLKDLEVLKAANIGLKDFGKFESIMQLMELDISRNDLSGVKDVENLQALSSLYNLHVLNISQTHLSDLFLDNYFEKISRRRTLKTFIDNNKATYSPETITKEECQKRANIFDQIPSFQSMTSLEHVDIGGNGCKVWNDYHTAPVDMGLTSANVFSDFDSLKTLDISYTMTQNLTALNDLPIEKLTLKGISLTKEACLNQIKKQKASACQDLSMGNVKSVEFTEPGTTTFTVPKNVYEISAEGCSGGEGGQGGQGGQAGYDVSDYQVAGKCSNGILQHSCNQVNQPSFGNNGIVCVYYCVSNTQAFLGQLGGRGETTWINDDLFVTSQSRSDESYGALCAGGVGGSGGQNGGVPRYLNYPENTFLPMSMPLDGAQGRSGIHKMYTKNSHIAVRPGQVLRLQIGSGGRGGDASDGVKKRPCREGVPDYFYNYFCGEDGKAGQKGSPGTGGYLKISWSEF